jgi:hypothetical protein
VTDDPPGEFGFGPAWARDTGCCAKPAGCTNMTGVCLMRNHPWKRAHAQPPPAEEPRIFYVLVCRECDPDDPLPMPFGSAAERGRWAAEHTAGTGHNRWIVLDQRV